MEAAPEGAQRASGRMRLGFVVAGALIVLSTAGATVGIGMMQVKHIANDLKQYGHVEQFQRGTITPPPAGKPQTLLLVGSDRRFGDARGDARSDTMMLVRLDPKSNATTVLSIPRDLRVTIPGHGIDKINSAYGLGGLDLTTRTVSQLLSTPKERFRVNHAIAVSFRGFRDAVDVINCVYVDVDRRDYVRFRHLDNDIVRAARQQDFLRSASAQMSTGRLIRNLHPLVRAFAKATSSDSNLQTSRGILRLLRLAASSASRPVRQITFPHEFVHTEVAAPATTTGGFAPAPTGLGDYVTASPEKIQAAVREFMQPRAARHRTAKEPAKKKRGGKKRARVSAASYRLVPKLSAAKEIVRPALAGSGFEFPVYAPAWLTSHGRYPASTGVAPSPRLYTIRDRHGRRHRAYRLVVEEDQSEGQYYGIQGTTWQTPPILDGKHSSQRLNGRSFHVYVDGSRIRLISWHTARGVYWVSNTLSRDIKNRQMLGIARSLTRIRR
jgi:anionic cell wall polymer biosynthesis LytR-Cps2A-Psr (LCP) family protein